MNFKSITICCLFLSLKLLSQDTLVIKAYELGIPRGHSEPFTFTLVDKYGTDSTNWPFWTRADFDWAVGMDLSKVELRELILNDSLVLRFDKSRGFERKEWPYREHMGTIAHYYQNGLIFSERDSVIRFLSMIRPLKEGAVNLKLGRGNQWRSLAYLDSLKKVLPKSYGWRDGIPSSFASDFFYNDEDIIDLAVVPIGIAGTNHTLELHYYKERLIYVYHSF